MTNLSYLYITKKYTLFIFKLFTIINFKLFYLFLTKKFNYTFMEILPSMFL